MGRVLALAVAAALVAGGCTDGGRPAAAPSTAPPGTTTPATASAAPPTVAAGTPAGPGAELLRYDWLLLDYTLAGRRTVRMPDVAPFTYTFTIVGGRLKAWACNMVEGPVTVGDGWLDVGQTISTQRGCSGAEAGLQDAFSRVLDSPRATWAVADGRLRLTAADGTTLRYEAVAGEYPGGRARTLASGTYDGWRYRFYAAASGDIVKVGVMASGPAGEVRRGGWDWRKTGLRSRRDLDHFGWFMTKLGDARFLGGLAPPGTVRVVYRPAGGGPAVTVGTHDVPGLPFEGYAFVVGRNPLGSTAVAYDSRGRELGRWTRKS
jgi:heat shock protein HslJ